MKKTLNPAANPAGDFFTVQRYVCRFCGKEFKTAARHQCKFNPSFRNCFSCKRCTGIQWIDAGGETISEQDAKEKEDIGCSKVFSCASHMDQKNRSIIELSARNWKSDCPMYEMIPGYTGKDSFLRRMWGIEADSGQGSNPY